MSAIAGNGPNAPDLIAPVVGFRQWRLTPGGLCSVYSEAQWAGPELKATCPTRDHDPVPAPAKACTCGIHAYYDPCPRTASAATRDLVAGAVVLWGSIELHATGMRGQYARIVALALPASHGRKRREILATARTLSVPVVPHRELRAVAEKHGLPLGPMLRPPRRWAEATAEGVRR